MTLLLEFSWLFSIHDLVVCSLCSVIPCCFEELLCKVLSSVSPILKLDLTGWLEFLSWVPSSKDWPLLSLISVPTRSCCLEVGLLKFSDVFAPFEWVVAWRIDFECPCSPVVWDAISRTTNFWRILEATGIKCNLKNELEIFTYPQNFRSYPLSKIPIFSIKPTTTRCT